MVRTLRKQALVGVVACAVLLFSLLQLVPGARAIESAGIGAVPANPRADNPRTSSIFVFEANGGEKRDDEIKVINNSSEAKTIRVYAVDSQHSSDGAFACAQEADPKKAVGGWIQLSKQEIALQPGTSETVPFTLTLPADVEPGEHNGCLAVQEETPPRAGASNGIVLSFRSALRVAVTVPGDIHADVRFLTIHSIAKGDKLQLSPVLANDGNVSVDSQLSVGLRGIFGNKVAEQGGKFALLKAEESRFNFEVSAPFWGGWYQKVGSISYVPLREKVADRGAEKTATLNGEWIFVAPAPLAIAIEVGVLALLFAGGFWWWYRRNKLKLLATRTKPYIVQPGDNLQMLAEASGVAWRTLATLNNLKPPYSLQAGTTIRLPEKRAASGKVINRG